MLCLKFRVFFPQSDEVMKIISFNVIANKINAIFMMCRF